MNEELSWVLAPAYPERGIATITRSPYEYATSFALEQVDVTFADGSVEHLILKDFDRRRMLPNARESRPALLECPSREIDTYVKILGPGGIGPRCVATVVDALRPRHWLICEKVPGVELWQVGGLDRWCDVVRWLARMHRAYEGRGRQLMQSQPSLLRHDAAWFRLWADRARDALRSAPDVRAARLADVLRGYDDVAISLASLPTTFVHGELYPSNVMIGSEPVDGGPWPVDWEMAATGPALVDLAALCSGWGGSDRAALLDAYGPLPGTADDLRRCELHLALQWIDWSPRWRPPAAHARDWLGDAVRLAEEVLG